MKKKLAILLLLSVLMVGRVEDIYASSLGGGGSSFDYDLSTCNYCAGDWENYWKDNLEDFNCWNCITHSIYGGVVHSCENKVFYIPANGDVKYYFKFQGTNSNDQICWVQLSTDNLFEVSSVNGPFEVSDAKGYGESNGLFYCYSYKGIAASSNYVETFCSGYNYLVNFDCDIYTDEIEDKLIEFAKYLSGETSELPSGATMVEPLPVYDLEPPLNVKVNTGSASVNLEVGKYGTNGSATLIPHKIWWEQSNIDLTGYTTEFYVREFGKCRKSIFSKWEDCVSNWTFDGEHVTAKYCNNNLKFHEYRSWESDNLTSVAAEQLVDDEPEVEFNSCDFMIRNKKVDDDGQTHYSNWVYVNTYEDGTYSVYEMVSDYDLDEDSDETGNIDVDSEIYDDEVIHTDSTDVNIDVGGVSNVGSFLTVMKDLANSIKTFPDFFAQVFSFLPNWILTSIGTLFVIILICAIF